VAWSPDIAMPEDFAAAMDDDLGTPAAMAVLFRTIKDGNVALDAGNFPAVKDAYVSVRSMLGVLGLDPGTPEWASAGASDDLKPVVDGLVTTILEQRAQARERKDWAAADAIRDRLAELGLAITDTPAGPRWSLEK
jgi:cysteinyl-tRNA synthetase